MICCVTLQVVEAVEAGRAVEFIGPIPGEGRAADLFARGINKGMLR